MQLKVAEPDVVVEVRATLSRLSEQAVPPFWVRLTVPVKLFTAAIVIVELAD